MPPVTGVLAEAVRLLLPPMAFMRARWHLLHMASIASAVATTISGGKCEPASKMLTLPLWRNLPKVYSASGASDLLPISTRA